MTIKLFMIVVAYMAVINIITWTIILRMIYFAQRQKDPLVAYIEKPKKDQKIEVKEMELIG